LTCRHTSHLQRNRPASQRKWQNTNAPRWRKPSTYEESIPSNLVSGAMAGTAGIWSSPCFLSPDLEVKESLFPGLVRVPAPQEARASTAIQHFFSLPCDGVPLTVLEVDVRTLAVFPSSVPRLVPSRPPLSLQARGRDWNDGHRSSCPGRGVPGALRVPPHCELSFPSSSTP